VKRARVHSRTWAAAALCSGRLCKERSMVFAMGGTYR
jgi:hypothetical protein